MPRWRTGTGPESGSCHGGWMNWGAGHAACVSRHDSVSHRDSVAKHAGVPVQLPAPVSVLTAQAHPVPAHRLVCGPLTFHLLRLRSPA